MLGVSASTAAGHPASTMTCSHAAFFARIAVHAGIAQLVERRIRNA